MTDSKACPRYGNVYEPARSPHGLCLKCLIAAGMRDPGEVVVTQGAPRETAPDLATIAPLFPELVLEELVGQGGMGFVYRARHPELDRKVALELLARGLGGTVPTEQVSRTRIGGVGLVAGFASGVSGAGWGPIGVKLLLLLRIEPRRAIGSSLLGRVFRSASAVVACMLSAKAFEGVEPQMWLVLPLFAGSVATMAPGVFLVIRL